MSFASECRGVSVGARHLGGGNGKLNHVPPSGLGTTKSRGALREGSLSRTPNAWQGEPVLVRGSRSELSTVLLYDLRQVPAPL